MRSDAIKKVAQDRQIPYLLHFTRYEHLNSILQNGILCTSQLGNGHVINDEVRYDNRQNRVCTSIAFPNGKMFYKYRVNAGDDWCVLAIRPEVLWEADCLFCTHNAADNRISCLSDNQLNGPDALAAMFDESDALPSRESQDLQPFHTTDVQAEVMILDKVAVKYIFAVVFPTIELRDKNVHLEPKHKMINNSLYFSQRGYAIQRLYS